MMEQLGITRLRPGPSGNESAPNHANYDEATANPFPNLPDPLRLKNGERVTTPFAWWERRRPEIIEDFEREVIGRIPAGVPRVTWSVTETTRRDIGAQHVSAKRLVGHVDNAAYPAIAVDLRMMLVTPAGAGSDESTGPAPVVVMFRGGEPSNADVDPPIAEQTIAAGWGYATLSTASIQADNGAGLTRGIIGLVNRGQPRRPDDWGSLRAWSWGAARALDYLETDRAVDPRRVAIEGVSRYGKAALVTMAFEPRFAAVLVGSSGEGGAKLHRRNWGEAVENLTGAGEYHWMAGNFLKYGAAESAFGSRNAGDLPVDAHELIALCAPRAVFVSYGVPERGDARWLDQQGSFMAAVAAGPVFTLLQARDLGVSESYASAKMPPVNTGLLDGQLAWRQHDGGHTDVPNWPHFLAWADRVLVRGTHPADRPLPRLDQNSMIAHAELLEKTKQGRIDVYFVGDSIARRWGATDYPELLANWRTNFHGWNAADFAWGADTTQHMLWRLDHGELDGIDPKAIVILAGANNVGTHPGDAAKADDIAEGVTAVVNRCLQKAPHAIVILTAIFPRNDNATGLDVMPTIERANAKLARLADGRRVRFLNVNAQLADASGRLREGMMHDKLHPTVKGYQVWADGLKPMLREILGPPAADDHAPPPTGDPGARRR